MLYCRRCSSGRERAGDETAAHEARHAVVPALLSIESIPDWDVDDAVLTAWRVSDFHRGISFRQVRDRATLPPANTPRGGKSEPRSARPEPTRLVWARRDLGLRGVARRYRNLSSLLDHGLGFAELLSTTVHESRIAHHDSWRKRDAGVQCANRGGYGQPRRARCDR